MLIKRTRGWELPEARATPEGLYLRRRELVQAMGFGTAALALARKIKQTFYYIRGAPRFAHDHFKLASAG